MKFDVNEITSLIKEEVKRYQAQLEVSAVGTVLEVGDGIARVYGLENVMANEMLEFEGGIIGEAFNLDEDSVGVVLYGDAARVREGSPVRSTGRVLSVPVGEELLGRVVNALCEPIDGLGKIHTPGRRFVETAAPGIAARQPVKEPLATGLKSIDAMIPIGRGQRELIIGTARRARRPSRWIRSSIRRARGSSVFTWPSARRIRPSRRWWRFSRSTGPWSTRS